ncbi:hypothetical protein GCM10010430_40250 [Kitasatospora cystarginea]|uniref:Uncharacterized protein n=1 Tax=Kitasatospora cystarginea TaxID=58350 RepID=A0ABP5R6Q2_9ACTN
MATLVVDTNSWGMAAALTQATSERFSGSPFVSSSDHEWAAKTTVGKPWGASTPRPVDQAQVLGSDDEAGLLLQLVDGRLRDGLAGFALADRKVPHAWRELGRARGPEEP